MCLVLAPAHGLFIGERDLQDLGSLVISAETFALPQTTVRPHPESHVLSTGWRPQCYLSSTRERCPGPPPFPFTDKSINALAASALNTQGSGGVIDPKVTVAAH